MVVSLIKDTYFVRHLWIFLLNSRAKSYLYLMKGSVIFVFLIGLLTLHMLNACKEQNKESDSIELVEVVQFYCQTPFKFPLLTPEAQEIITDWPVFKDFRRISQNLVNIPLEDLKFRSNNLRLQTDSLSVTVPQTLESPIINARLLVVKTRISLLNQEAKKSTPDSTVIEKRLLELHQSIDEFILHINEKIEKDRLDQKGVQTVR
ncbi:MAG: hypothetical protein EBT51_09765 [Flavobacteriaceae bacterium]|jgi:hypothetical protein|nr:hypothetical protein [Flavobacteriaceae bacterium]